MTAFAIARYLTHEMRRRAVNETYIPDPRFNDGRMGWARARTAEGYCPLGVALADSEFLAPDSARVCELLNINPERDPERYAKIREAAAEFIRDWDYGHIKNLNAALLVRL